MEVRSLELGTKDHPKFITKLLLHPVIKEAVHENFPNGLSPLDLAQQFELHHIAALIEGWVVIHECGQTYLETFTPSTI